MLQQASFGLAGLSLFDVLAAKAVFAAEAQKAAIPLAPLNRFPRMVQEYFVERVRQAEQLAEKRRASIHSQRDAEVYVRDVRAKIQQCFGSWLEKTPLKPRVTGAI